MAQSQVLENVWQVYIRIIDETLKAATHTQSTAVLEQLKKRWLAHLTERIRVDAETPKGPNLTEGASTVSRGFLKGARLKVTGTPTDCKSVTSVGESLVQHRQMAPELTSENAVRLPWAIADPPAMQHSDPWALPADSTSAKHEVSVRAEATLVTPDARAHEVIVHKDEGGENGKEVVEEEEDDWGDWESAEAIAGERAPPTASLQAEVSAPSEVAEAAPQAEEGFTDMAGNYVPTEADFATRVRTQYGRTQGVGDVVTAGHSQNWPNSDLDDPDAVDSDLDNVPDFDDDEPQARDVIVAQVETVTRPPGRKAQSQGLWKIKARNGVARIDGQEIFFDTLYADLEF